MYLQFSNLSKVCGQFGLGWHSTLNIGQSRLGLRWTTLVLTEQLIMQSVIVTMVVGLSLSAKSSSSFPGRSSSDEHNNQRQSISLSWITGKTHF